MAGKERPATCVVTGVVCVHTCNLAVEGCYLDRREPRDIYVAGLQAAREAARSCPLFLPGELVEDPASTRQSAMAAIRELIEKAEAPRGR